MSGTFHYCERCAEPVYPGEGVVAWRLDGSEVVVHADISICEYEIRTNPDVVPLELVVADTGIREYESRMSGGFERDHGAPSYLRGA